MWVRVSIDLPHLVVVRDLSTLSVFLAFSVVFAMCLEKLSLGSKVIPRILGFWFVGMVVLFIVSERVSWNSELSGVNRVAEDLSGLSRRSLSWVQVYIESR